MNAVVAKLSEAYPCETPLFKGCEAMSVEQLEDVYRNLNRRYPPQKLYACLEELYRTFPVSTEHADTQQHIAAFLESAQQVGVLCNLFAPETPPSIPILENTLAYEKEEVRRLRERVEEQNTQIQEILTRLSVVEKHVQDLQFYCF